MRQSKAHPRLPNTLSRYEVLLYLHAAVCMEFQCQIILHPISTPFGGGYGGPMESKMVQIKMSTPVLCDFYTQYRPILHRLTIIHNAAHRAIRIGRLCYARASVTPSSQRRNQSMDTCNFNKRRKQLLWRFDLLIDSELNVFVHIRHRPRVKKDNKKSPQLVGQGPPTCSQIVGRSTLTRIN